MAVRLVVAIISLLVLSRSALALTYDESIDGDLPRNEATPQPIGVLDSGSNVVSGSAAFETEFGDSFSVELAPGHEIQSVDIEISGHTSGFIARGRIFEQPVFVSIESRTFTEDGFFSYTSPPIAPGPFGFSAVYQTSGVAGDNFDWVWTIIVPEPRGAAAQIVGLATLFGVAAWKTRSICL